MSKLVQLVFAAVLGSVITLVAFQKFGMQPAVQSAQNTAAVLTDASVNTPTVLSNYSSYTAVPGTQIDFTFAASKSTPAVVHIKSTVQSRTTSYYNDPFDLFGGDFFFGPRRGGKPTPQVGTGSGVIISPDGFIVTNNHVVSKADEIEVTLHDKRTYKAKMIGTDPSTDLALIKIEDTNLPTLTLANSDEAKVGEWVLAVGNPFNLESTVTAGIVSAKGRNLKLLEDRAAIESFIQTDAAVNPGNSGGALVNTSGQLLGINTAIATPTGTYAGYSFAVPANIVSKVVEDLKNYGVVQRAFLGISITNVDGNVAKEKNLAVTQGVLVAGLMETGPAIEAGIKEGDVIVRIENAEVKSIADLQGQVARYRPGDKINITVNRNGSEKTLFVLLKNKDGNTDLVTKSAANTNLLAALGAELESLTNRESQTLGIRGGVRVKALTKGKIATETDIRQGFIITGVDGKPINSTEQLLDALEAKKGGGVLLEGVYPNTRGTYYYGLGI